MLLIQFAGWAQCRLATDPDPYDEPRGVSGYIRAYAGEPDLDRIIRFQDPPFLRKHTPMVGVSVRTVSLDGTALPDHPLVGAAVNLHGDSKFEGRNGAVSEDGEEPISPFDLGFSVGGDSFSRATVPTDPASPFREFNASDLKFDEGFITQATGVESITAAWSDRLDKLRVDAESATDELPAIEERIEYLERALAAAAQGVGVAGFWAARMIWDYELKSSVAQSSGGTGALLPDFDPTDRPWPVNFWFGGWDSDAQLFFVRGTLSIASTRSTPRLTMRRRPERMMDIDRAT
ncbi:hypothetical protein [Bradyrhizobium sp.]|jgi:hypothetical protein|uniref:hypothetical protein n=1 Tax=Bradyrhizobium sp. TaxID=376 RepID=UPI002E07584F|nr:hypothetical protein [Bradyrhizobium sp.]